MDSRKRKLKTFEELNKMKEKSEAMKKLTDESSKLLMEAHTLSGSISSALKNIDTAGKQMRNVADDIKEQLASDHGLDIDDESALANIATDTAKSDLDNTAHSVGINLGPAFQKVEEEKVVKKDKQFMNKLHFVTELVVYYDRDERDKTKKPLSAFAGSRSHPSWEASNTVGKSGKSNKPHLSALAETRSCPDVPRNVTGKKGKSGKTNKPSTSTLPASQSGKIDNPTFTLPATQIDTGLPVLRSYDELTAWQRDIDVTRRKKEDEMSRLLVEAHGIASSMAASLEDIIMAGSQLCKETKKIKSQFVIKDRLDTSGKSVLPSIELNVLTTDIANSEKKMRKIINKKDQFKKILKSAEKFIAALQIGRETVRTESPLSTTGNVETDKTTLRTPCPKVTKK